MKILFRNPNFLLLMISFSLSYAIYGAIASTVGSLANAFKFDSNSVSIFGAVFVVAGLVGSVIHALVLDKYKLYKNQYMFILTSTAVSFFLVCVGL